jgi:hypothetical protein
MTEPAEGGGRSLEDDPDYLRLFRGVESLRALGGTIGRPGT